MRCWPAIALVGIASACGAPANDFVATDRIASDTVASDPTANDSDAILTVGNEPQLLTPATTTTTTTTTGAEPTTTATATATAIEVAMDPTPPPALNATEAPDNPSLLGNDVSDLAGCPDAPRGAVTDKANQRYWLCLDGQAVTPEIPMTTASAHYGLPPVGTYPVFARDENVTGLNGEPLERFVAFYTTPRGNRIAFHEVVNQDPATVGDLDQRGSSAGCFRVRKADSIQVWEFLQVGDPVVVLTN